MTFIVSDPLFTFHLTGASHPECPARFTSIDKALKEAGLQTPQNTLKPRAATTEELLLCHTLDYIRLVQKETEQTKIRQRMDMLSTGDVVISPYSLQAALLAVGGVLNAVDAIMRKEANTVFCNSRPPGHHACSNAGMGFCLFNNVAIGARYIQKKYGLEKILIIDWDVHHGNGTQEIFYNDPSVMYFSTHQHGIYPGTGFMGEKGVGNIINCPIEANDLSRQAVFEAFKNVLVPSLKIFKPEFIFISCGFDAHVSDPLGGFNLTTDDFSQLTLLVKEMANEHSEGRIISALEGGYNLEAIAECAVVHTKALN